MSSTSAPTAISSPSLPTLAWRLLTAVGFFLGLGTTWGHIKATDFPVDMAIYRQGVEAFMSGGEMYSVPMHAGDLALPFIYPPFGALVMVPLTVPGFLTDNLAGDIVIVLSNVLIWLCLYAAGKHLFKTASSDMLIALVTVTWALMLTFEPVDLNNGFAQINVVIMALVFLDVVPRERRFLPEGTLVGIAAAIKLTPLVFGLYWLVKKDWKAIGTTALSAVVCTLLAALWRMDATIEFYFGTLLNMGTQSQIGVDTTYQSNSSLKGMVMRFAPDGAALEDYSTLINVIWLVLAVITVAVGAWLIALALRRHLTLDAILITAIVMLLISPVSWSHHWVWLTLILPVFAWRALFTYHNTKTMLTIISVWTLLLVTNPPKWWFGDAIDIWALSLVEKFLVSDFVWLAFALLAAVAVGVRQVKVKSPA